MEQRPTPRGVVKATPGLAVATAIGSLGAAMTLLLAAPDDWWPAMTLLGIGVILLGRVLADAIVDVVVLRMIDESIDATDAALIAFQLRWRLGRNVACRVGRHAPREDGYCPRCERGAPKHAPHEVRLTDGTCLTVMAVNEASARTKVVYGEAADLAWPRHPNQVQFAHGGNAEPLAEVKVHPSKIVSVRTLKEAQDAQ